MKVWKWTVMAALVALVSGCALIKPGSGTDEKVVRFAKLAEDATALGLMADLAANPQHRLPAEKARDALTVFVAEGNSDAGEFGKILDLMSPYVGQLQGQNATVFITGGMFILDLFTGDKAEIASDSAVKVVARGFLAGMNRGLGDIEPSGEEVKAAKPAAAKKAKTFKL